MKNNIVNINQKKVESYILEKRPPVEIRNRLDFGFKFERNTFELFEIRPMLNNPKTYHQLPFAKFRYVKTQDIWKLYWMRASGKWESYQPFPESSNIEAILNCIEEDAFGCFYG